ncbi:Roadkill [Operophtera brumata]|uniref:Roadkill n=1 Tax=Operophtera brumata TaxID=104452 RepID=A0A0L7KML2_OPEBR|nr:Roadkill [Operophtera brumata]
MEVKSKPYTIEVNKYTTRQIDTYEIEWNIPNFVGLLRTIDTSYGFRVPRQTVVEVPETPFHLKICMFKSDYTKLHVSVEIYYLISSSSPISLTFNLNSGVLLLSSKKDFKTIQANEWQCCMLMKCSLNPSGIRGCYPLCLSFKLMVSQTENPAVCSNTPSPYTELVEDLGNLLDDDSFSDVTMKSVEGIEFRVHKTILASRSEVLRAHFKQDMRENITNVVETPWESELLGEVLTFMYTGKAPRVDDAPDKLMLAAGYYKLDRLKSLCEEALGKRLTVENAVDTLQLAELYSANSLKQTTLEFIKNGRAALISQTEGWANIKSVELVKRIYDYIVDGINNVEDILAAAFKKMST